VAPGPESSQHVLLSYNEVVGQPNRKTRAWIPTAKVVILRQSADALADISPLLARVVEALGTNAAARMLGADRAQVSRWTAGTESIGSEMGGRIVDLHDVLTRILRVYGREAAAMWLVGSEPLLGGARPIVSFHMLQPQPTMSPAARLTFRPKAAEDWTTQEFTRSCI
jgi:uncharacterized protein (DUF2384 family)